MRGLNILITVIVSVCYGPAWGQNFLAYYALVNQAEIAHLEHDYRRAYLFYDRAFKETSRPFYEDCLQAALVAESLADREGVVNFLSLGIHNGLTKKTLKNHPQYAVLRRSSAWPEIVKAYPTLRIEYVKNLNVPLRKQIQHMIKQQKKSQSLMGKLKGQSAYEGMMRQQFGKIKVLIQQMGEWPGFSVLGQDLFVGKNDPSYSLSSLLMQFPSSEIKWIFPYLKRAVVAGEFYPYHAAIIYDYTQSNFTRGQNGGQEYGTLSSNGTILGIREKNKVNLRRAQLGLEPIEDFMKKQQLRLDRKVQ